MVLEAGIFSMSLFFNKYYYGGTRNVLDISQVQSLFTAVTL